MVTTVRNAIHGFRTHILPALILAACTSIYAEKGDAYIVAIKLYVGGAPITGFLYSVTDTSVVLIPGAGGPKALNAALESPEPVSIPLSLIKKLSVTRVRSFARTMLRGLVIFGAYAAAYVSFIPIETVAGLVIYAATVTTATIFTAVLLYTRNYKPTEPGFTITMQKYCLVKTGIVADGQ